MNAVFRIGDGLLARLPRLTRWAIDLDLEARWLPALASRVPLSVPVPVFLGKPTGHYASIWAVYEWIDGSPYTDEQTLDRARGFALHQAAMIIPYYRTSNPAVVSSAIRTVEQVIADTA